MKSLFLKFKWHLLGALALLTIFLVRSFGKSAKQQEYQEIVKDFFSERREDLAKKMDNLSDDVVKSEEQKVSYTEKQIEDLSAELDKKAAERLPSYNSASTSQRLKQLGFK